MIRDDLEKIIQDQVKQICSLRDEIDALNKKIKNVEQRRQWGLEKIRELRKQCKQMQYEFDNYLPIGMKHKSF